jgi:hypothetical protein
MPGPSRSHGTTPRRREWQDDGVSRRLGLALVMGVVMMLLL